MHLCPCHSAKPYKSCCKPYLIGSSKPRTVTQLMRSRFCAFAAGQQGGYLLNTWHPSSRGNLTAQALSEKSLIWHALEIVKSAQSGHTGTVEFIARFEDELGQHGVHHEVSRFVRETGQWFYIDGQIIST